MTDSYGQSIPYLDYTDKPDLKTLGEGIVGGLTPKSVMRFASASARDATITTPVAGMVAWLNDVKQLAYHNGTSWITITATDWTALTFASGYVAFSGNPAYRIINQRVELRGTVEKSDSSPFAKGSFFTICTLPSAAWPAYYRYFTGATQWAADMYGRIEVHPDGTIQCLIPSSGATGAAWISLDQVAYSLV
ncbi:hypothetical protein AAW14_06580 [Streptomyces hygroscopicus]|nr:hypothetical protein [Streptomyces hygroscopicus]